MAWQVRDSMTMSDVDLLNIRFRPQAVNLLNLCEELGLPFKVWETRRDHRRQAAYYAKGRTEPGKIVTKAPPGDSPHEWGFAIDLVLDIPEVNPWAGLNKNKHHERREYEPLWKRMADCARELGLTSGYHNWGWDWPHVQMKMWTEHRPVDWRDRVKYRLETTKGD